jgi:hypothetical protein
VSRTSSLVLYTLPSRYLSHPTATTGPDWLACWRATDRRTLLLGGDETSFTSRARLLRIAGRYVAFEGTIEVTEVDNDAEVALYLANARSGRVYKTATVSNRPSRIPPEPLSHIRALVVNDQGWMGWEVRRPGGASAIYRHDSRGNRLLDSASVHFNRLALRRNRLTWSLNGETRTANLH